MKNKIIKLARRLGNFTIEDIEPLLQCDSNKIKSLCEELSIENILIQNGSIYSYQKPKQENKLEQLPYRFTIHPKEEINDLIASFCLLIPVDKLVYLLKPQSNCITSFFAFFRETIYKLQLQELKHLYESRPHYACLRAFYEKKYYFYCYGNKVYISVEELKSDKYVSYTNEERSNIKKVYSFLRRNVYHNSYKNNAEFHLSEYIWRRNKNYDVLIAELHSLLGI